MILEYASQGSLFYFIRKNPKWLLMSKALVFVQIVEGIRYIHSNNIIHRDLKPENILIDHEGCIKICDFGWASIIHDNMTRQTFCGTYEYMAPEIIESKQYDSSVDVWSLGVLLYEMLHGFSPFKADSIIGIYKNIKEKNLRFSSKIDPLSKDLIKNILKVKINERLTVEQILNHPYIRHAVNFSTENAQTHNIERVLEFKRELSEDEKLTNKIKLNEKVESKSFFQQKPECEVSKKELKFQKLKIKISDSNLLSKIAKPKIDFLPRKIFIKAEKNNFLKKSPSKDKGFKDQNSYSIKFLGPSFSRNEYSLDTRYVKIKSRFCFKSSETNQNNLLLNLRLKSQIPSEKFCDLIKDQMNIYKSPEKPFSRTNGRHLHTILRNSTLEVNSLKQLKENSSRIAFNDNNVSKAKLDKKENRYIGIKRYISRQRYNTEEKSIQLTERTNITKFKKKIIEYHNSYSKN